MTIQVLGTGHCSKCATMFNNAKEAVSSLGLSADVVKIDDINQIISMGIMSTPGLAIDGKVLSSGRVLTVERISELLKSTVM